MNHLVKIYGVLSFVALFPLTAVAENQNRTAINPEHLSDSTVYGYSQANVVKANSVMVYAGILMPILRIPQD